MIAFVGAGRAQPQHALIDAMQAAVQATSTTPCSRVKSGLPASEAIQAFGHGDHARATQLLRSIRSGAHRFGGSHAQRDLIDLTLLEAAPRAGDRPLAAALAAERLALKPRSRAARLWSGWPRWISTSKLNA